MSRRVVDRAQLDALLRTCTNYEKMPAFHAGRVRADLERMRSFVVRLAHPERAPLVAHVTGTKGKGSTAAFLARMLRARGASVGLHTSPHLESMEERIVVDDAPIDDVGLLAATNAILAAADVEPPLEFPTFFEWATLTAFLEFERRAVRYAVHEVGLGGRLDATNVVVPAVSILTNVDLEHTAILGSTRAEIAREKAGIVKPGAPVVTALHPSDPVFDVVAAAADAAGVPIRALGRDFAVESVEHSDSGIVVDVTTWRGTRTRLRTSVHGAFQADNLAVAVAAIDVLREGGRFDATDDEIRAAVLGLRLRGRLELLRERPALIVDGAHTPQSVALAFAAVRRSWPGRKTVVLFGMAADKDWTSAAANLVAADWVVTTRYDHVRAVEAERLAAAVVAAGGRAEAEADANAGLARACAQAGADGVVFVVGSLYLVAEVRRAVVLDPRADPMRNKENVAWNT